MSPNLHSKGAHCCLPRLNATFYIQVWTTSEKTPRTVTFIPKCWIHPWIFALCIPQVMKRQQLARSREPAHQTLSHFAAGTTSKDWELPCAPHPSHSQLRFLQQPQHLSSYTQISPKNLNFQPKVELAAVWLAAAGFCYFMSMVLPWSTACGWIPIPIPRVSLPEMSHPRPGIISRWNKTMHNKHVVWINDFCTNGGVSVCNLICQTTTMARMFQLFSLLSISWTFSC